MGLFDRLFGRKKEKKEDIREEELVQTEVTRRTQSKGWSLSTSSF